MRKLKYPTRQEQNTAITYKQKGFGGGMYLDPEIPASEIPDNAVRWAFNALLYPDYVEVRPGTEKHSNLIPPFIDGRDNYEATKTGYFITKTAGDDFTAEDVDSYFYWPDSGRRDLIVDFVSGTTVQVKHDDAETPTTAANPGAIMGPENAKRLFHNSSRKLFAFFGTEIYWTEWWMDEWHRIPLRSSIDPADIPVSAESEFDQSQSNVYLINSNGIFVVDTRTDPMELWKSNTPCADNTIAEVAEGGANVFGRRYLTTLSRIVSRSIDNRFDGYRIQNESGTNNVDHDTQSQDYRTVYGVDPDAGDRIIGPITLPVGAKHWTHVPIYATNNLALETTDQERYVLMDEIPICKAFDAFRYNATGNINVSVGGNGQFDVGDVGNTIQFADGTVDTITAYISPTEVAGTGVLVGVAGQGAAIGGGRVMTALQADTLITRVDGDVFNINDENRMIFWADGYWSFIEEYIDNDHVRAISAATHVQQGATINPVSRYYNDRIPDETLNNRASKFPLYQRFWKPLPTIKTGVIVPGFLVIAPYGVDEIHYSHMPVAREYLAGYYNDFIQMAPIKDSITALHEFRDRMVIYCANSTYWVATNVSLSAEVPSIGQYIAVLSGVNNLDLEIGAKDRGGFHRLRDGSEIVITSEPGVRLCNGQNYSENRAVDAEGRSFVLNELQKAQMKTACGYDQNKLGFLIYYSDQLPDN